MRASVLFAAASWQISTFAYVAETGEQKASHVDFDLKYQKSPSSVAQPLALFPSVRHRNTGGELCHRSHMFAHILHAAG